jgi:hypothetical protein
MQEPTTRLLCNRITTAAVELVTFEMVKKANPALDRIDHNATIGYVDEKLSAMGYKEVFGGLSKELKLEEMDYPPEPDLVVAYHALLQTLQPEIERLRAIQF